MTQSVRAIILISVMWLILTGILIYEHGFIGIIIPIVVAPIAAVISILGVKWIEKGKK